MSRFGRGEIELLAKVSEIYAELAHQVLIRCRHGIVRRADLLAMGDQVCQVDQARQGPPYLGLRPQGMMVVADHFDQFARHPPLLAQDRSDGRAVDLEDFTFRHVPGDLLLLRAFDRLVDLRSPVLPEPALAQPLESAAARAQGPGESRTARAEGGGAAR